MEESLTHNVDESFGTTVAVLIMSHARVLARLVAAESVVERQTRPVTDNLVVVLPIIIGQRISR